MLLEASRIMRDCPQCSQPASVEHFQPILLTNMHEGDSMQRDCIVCGMISCKHDIDIL